MGVSLMQSCSDSEDAQLCLQAQCAYYNIVRVITDSNLSLGTSQIHAKTSHLP